MKTRGSSELAKKEVATAPGSNSSSGEFCDDADGDKDEVAEADDDEDDEK